MPPLTPESLWPKPHRPFSDGRNPKQHLSSPALVNFHFDLDDLMLLNPKKSDVRTSLRSMRNFGYPAGN
jgi:hypothetical protein